MPEWRRQEIRRRIDEEPRARQEYERVKQRAEAARNPDMFSAGLIYALDGDRKYADVAAGALQRAVGGGGPSWWRNFYEHTDWEGGMPHMSPVWYGLDISQYVVYDWIYDALSDDVREDIHEGLRLMAKARMRSLDTWSYTANLVFKPMFMVAFAGLALQDDDILEWGFRRGGRQGHFYSLMNRQLPDGSGPWHEAPIYAVSHNSLWCMSTMAFYRHLYDGGNWFDKPTDRGGSPRGLMDYYIGTAYPIENTGVGAGRIRIATHGHGSTNVRDGRVRDLFLLSPNRNDGILAHEELKLAYAASRDERYAALIEMMPETEYAPDLWSRPPLPVGKLQLPDAPSNVWPQFGLAMLRSDESPDYWTNPDAIAVFHIMTRSYPHGQQDKFHINLFGANRLLYPDFLAFQYENYALGWTTSTVSKNTMMVDEADSDTAEPHVRSAFSPELKYLAISAEGVFDGVAQTRGLMLTGEYLLDLFHATSKTKRTYDYNLRSFGRPQPVEPDAYRPTDGLSPRYWPIEEQQRMATSECWQFEFVVKDSPDEDPDWGVGDPWYDHEARVRVTMAAAPDTVVCYGTWGKRKFLEGAAEIIGPEAAGRSGYPDMGVRLGMLTVRRDDRRDTVFVATHEPSANEQLPVVNVVTVIASTDQAMVVRVDADGFTDYAAMAWGAGADEPLQMLGSAEDESQVFSFRDYGYLRIPDRGAMVARGGWQGLRVPVEQERVLILNGAEHGADFEDGYFAFGELPDAAGIEVADRMPESPFEVEPERVRVSQPGRTGAAIMLTNPLDVPVGGRLDFAVPDGISIEPEFPEFGPIEPGQSQRVEFAFIADDDAGEMARDIPLRFHYSESDGEAIATQYVPMPVTIGRSFRTDRSRDQPAYVAETPTYTARLMMANGLPVHLEDPAGDVKLDGRVLFTYGTREIPVVTETPRGSYVWGGLRMTGQGQVREAGQFLSSRYTLAFDNDRIRVGIDAQWTNFSEAHFKLPGDWHSPGGEPVWKRVIGLADNGAEIEVDADDAERVVAAELEFPGAEWNLAFEFQPAQEVVFDGAGMQFAIDVSSREQWSLGFVRPGQLDEWRR